MGYGQADQTDREMMALALAQARISLDGGATWVEWATNLGVF